MAAPDVRFGLATDHAETVPLVDLRELELLAGDREGQHSIRVNDQWRVCFEWRDGHAWGVEILDYH
ncbi:type II toxin-antitoxin system RelE/ParE family toxin [Thioalkalicoccus limnaeus]|uniref:type II toxin-antitoxin system RelE/ParE family toxin n=1 Tax=Thioalkalicoccus limnaeus TaxID=120681 RepID=UPI003F7439DB